MTATELEVLPMQWVELKKLRDVEPINNADLQCMEEVRAVLKKHGKQSRFGVALLHKHFEMDDSELLLENSDEETREMVIKPVKRDAAENSVPTLWMLLDGENRIIQSCSGKDVDAPQCS